MITRLPHFLNRLSQIITDLLAILVGVLRLEVCYLRFDDPAGGPSTEVWHPAGQQIPTELDHSLAAALGSGRPAGGNPIVDCIGDWRVISMAPGFRNEQGLVFGGARRPDFPADLELYLLRVAAGQAMVAIHTARRLAEERSARLAAEAALQLRNDFLTTLAQDLAIPIATLSARAAEAGALAAMQQHIWHPNENAVAANVPDRLASAGAELHPASPARLTRRETEVLTLMAQGLSNKEIGGVLWLSERTVERHITGMYRKLGVERRSEAAIVAVRRGLTDPNTRIVP